MGNVICPLEVLLIIFDAIILKVRNSYNKNIMRMFKRQPYEYTGRLMEI